MVIVIASIYTKKGRLSEFIEIFKANVPNVLKEKGCVEYAPTIDLSTDHPAQVLNENVVTIIKKWNRLVDLHNHFSAPHMIEYKEKVKDMVDKVTIKVLSEV